MRPFLRINHVRSRAGKGFAAGISLGLALAAAPATAQNVRATGFNDVAFGSISNLGADQVLSDSLCAYSSTNRYSVRATGSGTAGAFTLSSGTRTVAYEVQWNAAAGQTSGTSLTSGVTRGGFTATAKNQQCTSGATTTASLIVILRSAAVSSASAGSYSGTLSITLAPE